MTASLDSARELLERNDVLDALALLLAESPEGMGRVVPVRGEAGVGRIQAVRGFVDSAGRVGPTCGP